MNYYLNLFSPDTYEVFSKTDKCISGFRIHQFFTAQHIFPGDKFICYLTKLSRWVGILEVTSECFEDHTPLYSKDDPFVIRFKVSPVVWLDKNKSIPIRDEQIWENLSFTKGRDRIGSAWTGPLRSSLKLLSGEDGRFLENQLITQMNRGVIYTLSKKDIDNLRVREPRPIPSNPDVLIPQDEEETENESTRSEIRESIKIQALLADIGAKMHMQIWLPRNDKVAVLKEWNSDYRPLLETLPLNYNETTIKTIEQIDVLWLRGNAILRAFEVEHTTSIHSGILRMADLLALQPNMDIKLHIVAPISRREKVFHEIKRPVFSLLQRGPLFENCSYLSYERVQSISQLKHLSYLSDNVLDEYAEFA